MLWFYSLRTALSKNCTGWEHSLSGQVWTKCPTRPDTQGAPRGGCSHGPQTAVGLPIYDFLLMYSSDHMSIPHHLAVIAAWKIFSKNILLSLIIRPRFQTPIVAIANLPPGGVSLKFESLHARVKGKPPAQSEFDWLNTLWNILLTDRCTHTRALQYKPLAGFKYMP